MPCGDTGTFVLRATAVHVNDVTRVCVGNRCYGTRGTTVIRITDGTAGSWTPAVLRVRAPVPTTNRAQATAQAPRQNNEEPLGYMRFYREFSSEWRERTEGSTEPPRSTGQRSFILGGQVFFLRTAIIYGFCTDSWH